SSFTYGPTVRLRLLSTPLRADAVTFSYGAVAYSDTDFHRADVTPSRAHSPPNVLIGGPVPVSPGFPIEACGNDGLRNCHYVASCGEFTAVRFEQGTLRLEKNKNHARQRRRLIHIRACA